MGAPSWLRRLVQRPQIARKDHSVASGLVAFRATLGGVHARVHVRMEPDGTALALINASAAVRLTPPGATMARMLLERHPPESILRAIQARFDAPREQVMEDLAELEDTLGRLARSEAGSYPIEDLTGGLGARASALSAPLGAWVEMAPTHLMIPRLDALWEAAVPHVTLLVNAQDASEDVVRAVERAEDLGMICGLRGLGRSLSPDLLSRCADAGVDCVQIPMLSSRSGVHDGLLGEGDHAAVITALSACVKLELCSVLEVPLIEATSDALADLADAARKHGIATVALWALVRAEMDAPTGSLPVKSLLQLAEEAEELSESGTIHALWAPPVMANPSIPLGEHIGDGPRSAGDAVIRVAQDGSVLPPRGAVSAGTLGIHSWSEIWHHPAFKTLRNATQEGHRCDQCPDLTQCRTECPLDSTLWARDGARS